MLSFENHEIFAPFFRDGWSLQGFQSWRFEHWRNLFMYWESVWRKVTVDYPLLETNISPEKSNLKTIDFPFPQVG